MIERFTGKYETRYHTLPKSNEVSVKFMENMSDLMIEYAENGYKVHSVVPRVRADEDGNSSETEGFLIVFEKS